jgi:hypothetical protein
MVSTRFATCCHSLRLSQHAVNCKTLRRETAFATWQQRVSNIVRVVLQKLLKNECSFDALFELLESAYVSTKR